MLKLIDFNDVQAQQMLRFFGRLRADGLTGDVSKLHLDPAEVVGHLAAIRQTGRILGSALVDTEDALQGLFIGTIGSHWFNPDDKVFIEMMLMVHPAHRSNGSFKRLLANVESKCELRGVHTIQVANSFRVDPASYQKVMKHYGFKEHLIFTKKFNSHNMENQYE